MHLLSELRICDSSHLGAMTVLSESEVRFAMPGMQAILALRNACTFCFDQPTHRTNGLPSHIARMRATFRTTSHLTAHAGNLQRSLRITLVQGWKMRLERLVVIDDSDRKMKCLGSEGNNHDKAIVL